LAASKFKCLSLQAGTALETLNPDISHIIKQTSIYFYNPHNS